MLDFIGREYELDQLQTAYDKEGLQAILIYGKRRIGKSELINESIKDSKYKNVKFQCQRTSYEDNLGKISELISLTFNIPSLKFERIEDLLSFLSNESKKQNIIISFDEYPYLRELKPGLDDIFQDFIDNHKQDNLKILFCGSYANIMAKMITRDSALFNRFNNIIFLQELRYYEAIRLCPKSYSDDDKIKIYSVFGGVPYYYTFINPNVSADENIINNVIDLHSPLSREAEVCLSDQLNKINSANQIFQTISSGICNFADIQSSTKITNPNNLNAPLKKLQEMELIEKKECINIEKNKKNRIYYSISDNYFDFYFRYVFQSINKINLLGPNKFYELIKDDMNGKFIPKIFEKISIQFIQYCTQYKQMFDFETIGSYYYDDKVNHVSGQIDAVAKDFNDIYNFFEVKYTNKPMQSSIVYKLRDKIVNLGLKDYKLGFISKSGFSDESLKVIKFKKWYHFDLNDILSIVDNKEV